MVAYEFPLFVDLGKFSPEVGSLLERVNADLSMFGYADQHVGLESEIGAVTLKSELELSEKEIELVREHIREGLSKATPECSLRVGKPRRQTGNSSNQSTAT